MEACRPSTDLREVDDCRRNSAADSNAGLDGATPGLEAGAVVFGPYRASLAAGTTQ